MIKKILLLILTTMVYLLAFEYPMMAMQLPFGIQPQMDTKQITDQKADYVKKTISLKSKKSEYELGTSEANIMYERDRININAFDQFQDIGIDIIEMKRNCINSQGYPNDLLYCSLMSDAVVYGEISKYDYDTTSSVPYHCTYTVKIKEVLLDKGYFAHQQPEFVYIGVVGFAGEVSGYHIGQNYVLFLVASYSYYMSKNIPNKLNYMFWARNKVDITDKGLFNFNKQKYETIDFDTLKNKIKEIDSINDSYNFYNQNYK